jgi:hypothetical protein
MIRSRHALDRMDGDAGSRSLAHIFWAGGGFVAGVVFWHLIGFWSMVSVAVLGGGATPTATAPVAGVRKAPVPLETGAIAVRAPGCVALTLDRRTGATGSVPCRTGSFHHINGGLGRKDDKARIAPGWSTSVR